MGDYYIDHRPEDIQLLSDMAMVAAAAHVPFLTGALPSIMQMESWTELSKPARPHPAVPDRGICRVAVAAGRPKTPAISVSACHASCFACPTAMPPIRWTRFAFEEDVEGP